MDEERQLPRTRPRRLLISFHTGTATKVAAEFGAARPVVRPIGIVRLRKRGIAPHPLQNERVPSQCELATAVFPSKLDGVLTFCIRLRQLFLAEKRAHQPVGAIVPSTILQAFGAIKKAQPSHWWPSFGSA